MGTNFADLPGATDYRTSLFTRWAWLYALCRERLFADHTPSIAAMLRQRCCRESDPLFLELGCGPGFYAASLAKIFPQWRFLGLDQSPPLLERARRRTSSQRLRNCDFLLANAMQLVDFPQEADFILASRLFLILPDRARALHGIYAALRTGGALLIAEPLSGWRTELPLACMKLLDRFTGAHDPRECQVCNNVLPPAELDRLLGQQPWATITRWSDKRYQYALCEKGAPAQPFSPREALSELPEINLGQTASPAREAELR